MKRKTFNAIVLAASLGAFLVTGGVAAVVLMQKSDAPPPAKATLASTIAGPKLTAEQKAVRAYFEEHMEIEKIKIVSESEPKDYDGGKIVRVKYKAPSPLGGMLVLSDEIFIVRNGKALLLSPFRGPGKYPKEIFEDGISPDDPRVQR